MSTAQRTKAINVIQVFLQEKSRDTWACLNPMLVRWVEQDEFLSHNFEQPLAVLKHTIKLILDQQDTLEEFVRQIDVLYGETHSERPIFQKPGEDPHPEDVYTHQSVKHDLKTLLTKF